MFLYRHSKINKEQAVFAATQASLRQAALIKTPHLIKSGGFVTRRSLEQCSSEQLAKFKADQFHGEKVLVLASGLGIDDWAFSHSFGKVISVDTDNDLNEISRYNFKILGCQNIDRIDGKAEDFLSNNSEMFDLIYIDPDRRNEKGRQILLSQHQPNIVELLPQLFNFSSKVLIKCSPLYDYEMALKEISNVSSIYSISKLGEMKELLILAESNFKSNLVKTHCCDLGKDNQISSYETSAKAPLDFKIADVLGKHFYEAGSSLVKMRKQHEYAMGLGLYGFNQTVGFYTNNNLINNFIGRRFSIINSMTYNLNTCKKYLKEKNITQANLKARGLKFNTEEFRKRLQIKDGGTDYLFVFPFKNETMFLHCTY